MKLKIKITIFTVIISFIMLSCGKSNLYYGLDFHEIAHIAKIENRPFCVVVISDTSKTVYSEYISKLEKYNIERYGVVNVIADPDNWYKQWLNSLNPIITCIFSTEGNLKAVIAGNSKYSFEYIKENLRGVSENIDFGYRPLFDPIDKNIRIKFLDEVLRCKLNFDNNGVIEPEINHTLEIIQYPFNVYLKYLSEKSNVEQGNGIYYAKELLSFDNDIYYHKLYSDLFTIANRAINPEYRTEDLPFLQLDRNEIILEDCYLNEKRIFEVSLFNSGDSDLEIKTIDLGCSCIELITENIPVIPPNSSYSIRLQLSIDGEKEIMRMITILSNAQNSIETIIIRALSQKKEDNN